MCGLEFPDIEKQFHKPLQSRGLEIIGVNPGKIMMGGESPAMVQMFVDQTGVTFPIGFDTAESYKSFRYGGAISPFPLDVIVDKDGTVAYVKRHYDPAAMKRVVGRLLSK